jgi:hypothetical protein
MYLPEIHAKAQNSKGTHIINIKLAIICIRNCCVAGARIDPASSESGHPQLIRLFDLLGRAGFPRLDIYWRNNAPCDVPAIVGEPYLRHPGFQPHLRMLAG